MDKKEGMGALVFFIFGLFGLLAIIRLPIGSTRRPDVAFFPVVLSVLLMLLSLVLLGRAVRANVKEQRQILWGEDWPKLIPAVLGVAGYVFLLIPLGYLIATFGVLILFARLVKCSWKASLLISFLCTTLSYTILRYYLQTPLPQGFIALN